MCEVPRKERESVYLSWEDKGGKYPPSQGKHLNYLSKAWESFYKKGIDRKDVAI